MRSATDGADLTSAEHPRHRAPLHVLVQDPGIVVGLTEQAEAPPVTGEDQRGRAVLAGQDAS